MPRVKVAANKEIDNSRWLSLSELPGSLAIAIEHWHRTVQDVYQTDADVVHFPTGAITRVHAQVVHGRLVG